MSTERAACLRVRHDRSIQGGAKGSCDDGYRLLMHWFSRRQAMRSIVFSGLMSTLGFLSLAVAGCYSGENDPANFQRGHFIDMQGNDEMQLEVVADGELRQLIVYVWQKGTQTPLAVASESLDVGFMVAGEEVPVRLDASPRASDPEGSASRFAIGFDKLPKPLHTAADYTAKFTFQIDGASVTGAFQHHDDHSHGYHHD
ncbi:MAG: hypothetical protein AAGD07_04350 [Planctomycetota bacterium]